MRIASLPRKLAGGKCRVVGDRATAFEFRRSLSEISIIVSSAAPSPATVASGVWALGPGLLSAKRIETRRTMHFRVHRLREMLKSTYSVCAQSVRDPVALLGRPGHRTVRCEMLDSSKFQV